MPSLSIRVDLGPDASFGPGKARLLELIAETGSISAAARAMDMSYRRAWLLVDDLKTVFGEPMVATAAGGKRGGGAALTTRGKTVLGAFRRMERAAAKAAAREIARMSEARGSMKRLSMMVMALALAGAAAAADEPKKPPCENFPWPMGNEIAAFAATPADAENGASLTAWPEGAVKLTLKPLADAALPQAPGKAAKDVAAARAGWLALPAATAGTYEVTVAGKQWVDVIQDGKALESVAHASDPSCTAFHKSVRFTLTASPVTLQFSGEGADTVTFTILPGQD